MEFPQKILSIPLMWTPHNFHVLPHLAMMNLTRIVEEVPGQ
jgi:hypothetical protein